MVGHAAAQDSEEGDKTAKERAKKETDAAVRCAADRTGDIRPGVTGADEQAGR
jgi:hypothetical protein